MTATVVRDKISHRPRASCSRLTMMTVGAPKLGTSHSKAIYVWALNDHLKSPKMNAFFQEQSEFFEPIMEIKLDSGSCQSKFCILYDF